MSAEAATPAMDAHAPAGDLKHTALRVGAAGLTLSLAGLIYGMFSGDTRAIMGYLVGYAYWTSMCLGMLFLVMIFYIFDAGWAVIVRRQLEHAIGSFKYLAILFLPLLLVAIVAPQHLWIWMDTHAELPGHGTVGEDVLYTKKAVFLNFWMFLVFSLGSLGLWTYLATILRNSSFQNDTDGNPAHVSRCRKWSAAGIILTALTSTGCAIFWFKSLEYHWFSTMYGVWFFAESMRAALAGIIIICTLLARYGYLKGVFNRAHSYLIACLMLAFTVFWAYISFSQYFLIYNANIPEETFWYNIRELVWSEEAGGMVKSSWWWVSMVLVFGHFLFPFIYLLWYNNKFGGRVIFIACWILTMHLVDLWWNIIPSKEISEASPLGYVVREVGIPIFDLGAVLGIGGVLVWAFLKSAESQKPIPVRDPRILESITYHE